MYEEKKRDLLSYVILAVIFGAVLFLIMLDEGIISLEPPEYPQKISQEQLHALRVTSVISNWCLPDSIHHYMDSVTLKESSAMLFGYDYDAKFLIDYITPRLQEMGFVITDNGSSKVSNYDFYWTSAENGDIFTHVTMLYTGKRSFVSIASGKDVKEVLSIRIETDGNTAELSAPTYKPKNANLVLTAPLAGTIYAIYFPANTLCGNPNDDINIVSRRSFEDLLHNGTMKSPMLDLYWACDGFYNPERLTPTHQFIYRPRGVAYASVVLTGFGVK